MDRSFERNNDASRERLRDLVARLDKESLRRVVDGEWTVAALLAHLAFWDQSCVVRWDDYVAGGELVAISGAVLDVVNAANLPAWRALPGAVAAALAVQAAADADARIAALPDAAVAHAVQGGRRIMLDRSWHRNGHLDEIAASLGT